MSLMRYLEVPRLARVLVCQLRPYSSNGREQLPPLDFSDTKKAYQSKSFRDVLRQYVVFKALSIESLATRSLEVYKWSYRLLGKRLSNWLMRATVYGQFVAGEDLAEIKPAIARLKASGVKSILDYAVEEDITKKKEVVMETRRKDEVNAVPSPTDAEAHPQFQTVKSPGETTVKASARTYFYADEEKCEQNMENFLSCINTAADASDGEDAFAAIKLTGLGRAEFLLRLSEVVVGTHKIFLGLASSNDIIEARITPESFHRGLREMGIGLEESETDRLFRELDADQKGKLDVFQWFHHFQPGKELHKIFRSKKASKMHPLLAIMDDQEKQQMDSVVKRAKRLAECAEERGVSLMVDAEQTYFQPAIRHIAVNVLMPLYNLSHPVVYTTVQCYLKEAETTLKMDLKFSDISGFSYGVKLVRGAYMEQERDNAKEKGYEDPIWPTKEDTHSCYHHLVDLLLQQVELGKLHVLFGTHNEETVKFITQRMQEYNVDKSSGVVVFGQLLGMCDHVTFPLGQSGYCAYKYMPYGPVQEVIPYLSRRANENAGILDGAVRERELIGRELWRRVLRWK